MYNEPYPSIDPLKLRVLPLSERRNLLDFSQEATRAASAEPPTDQVVKRQIDLLAEKILAARENNAAIMFTYGAHLIKNGAGPLLNRLIETGLATASCHPVGRHYPRLGVCLPRT